MAKFKAHIKNIKNQSISIYIIDSSVGSIKQEHVINKLPSSNTRQEALRWIAQNYQNIDITEEGYFRGSPTTNTAGALTPEGSLDVSIDYPTPPSALPSIDSGVVIADGAPISQQQVSGILEDYAGMLSDNFLVVGQNTGAPTYARRAQAEVLEQDYRENLETARLEEEMKKYVDVRDNQYTLDDMVNQSVSTKSDLDKLLASVDPIVEEGNEFQNELFNLSNLDEEIYGPYPDASEPGKREKPPVFPKAKKAVQLDGLPKRMAEQLDKASKSLDALVRVANRGIGGDTLVEPVPQLQQTKTEHVIKNGNNAWIVLGRDRPSNMMSGYGGLGHTQAGAIDIVVGRMSPYVRQVDFDDKPIKVDPMFVPEQSFAGPVTDAARIYLSQKTDVDANFKLAAGRVGNAPARSAVAMKADAVRIIARDQGIKLVTRGKEEMRNSQGGNAKVIRGVDIIANNDDSNLQPMVLGTNLTSCLTDLSDVVSDVIGIVQALVANQAKLDIALSTHFHISPFFGSPTLQSPSLMPAAIGALLQKVSIITFSNAATKFNMVGFKQKYLGFQNTGPSNAPTMESVPITSKYNHVN